MSVSHEPWLVFLSIAIAIQGAFVGLSVVLRLNAAESGLRKRLLVGGALTLAVAIWSMHFVGMLAMRISEQVEFLLVPTIVSFLVSVVLVGLAVYVSSTNPESQLVLTLAGTIMGVGIVSMHFIGMLALHGNMMMGHDSRFVAASIVVGVLAANLAVRLAFSRSPPPLSLASIVLGLAISGMHYTAMAGLTLYPTKISAPNAAILSRDGLAIIVSLLAFLISGFFFLRLVPDPVLAMSEASHGPPKDRSGSTAAPEGVTGDHDHAASDGPANSSASGSVGAVPVIKDGTTIYVPVSRIMAVRADGHYTTVFDGRQSYFCNLPINQVESRLGSGNFMRVHRSHIVNVMSVASLKRSGDGGVVMLAGETPYALPISRRKLSELKSRLER